MKKILFLIIGVFGVITVFYFLGRSNVTTVINTDGQNPISESQKLASVLSGREYTNKKYSFSTRLPEGYYFREIASADSDTILFEKGGDGVQIMITSFEDLKELTADMIRRDIPDMKIEQVQTVEVGNNYKGVAFLSDNPDFGGASRDVWFVYKGNLYQISTYAQLDQVLKEIFSTWNFF